MVGSGLYRILFKYFSTQEGVFTGSFKRRKFVERVQSVFIRGHLFSTSYMDGPLYLH